MPIPTGRARIAPAAERCIKECMMLRFSEVCRLGLRLLVDLPGQWRRAAWLSTQALAQADHPRRPRQHPRLQRRPRRYGHTANEVYRLLQRHPRQRQGITGLVRHEQLHPARSNYLVLSQAPASPDRQRDRLTVPMQRGGSALRVESPGGLPRGGAAPALRRDRGRPPVPVGPHHVRGPVRAIFGGFSRSARRCRPVCTVAASR